MNKLASAAVDPTLAYALYRFPAIGEDLDPAGLRLTVTEHDSSFDPSDGELQSWLVLGDYSRDRWKWHRLTNPNVDLSQSPPETTWEMEFDNPANFRSRIKGMAIGVLSISGHRRTLTELKVLGPDDLNQ